MKKRKINQGIRAGVSRKEITNCGGRKRGGCSRVSTWESMKAKTFERI